MSQINTPVRMGAGNVGKKRLKLYREKIRARGYKCLSDYVVDALDRELSLEFSKAPRRETRQAIA